MSSVRRGRLSKLDEWSTLTGQHFGCQGYCCRYTRSLCCRSFAVCRRLCMLFTRQCRGHASCCVCDVIRARCHRCIERPRSHGPRHCLSPHYRSGPKISDQDRPRPPKVTGLSPSEPQGLCQAWLRPKPSTIRHLPNPAAYPFLIL